MGGVILHKVFGLLRCDHIDVTHLKHAHTRAHTESMTNRCIVLRHSVINNVLKLKISRARSPPPLKRAIHLVSEFDAVELVGGFEQLGPEGGGDELGVACQLHNHV